MVIDCSIIGFSYLVAIYATGRYLAWRNRSR